MAKISKGWAFVGAGSQAAAGNDKDIQFNNNENLSGSHRLQTDGTGSLSASAGITGSAFKTDGMVSASTFHGSGKHLTGVTASAISSSDGPLYSIQYRYNNPNGRELSGSHGFTFNPTTSPRLLTLGGGYRNARLSASAGITGSALKIGDAAGPGMISGSALHGTTLTAVGITGSDAKISGIASGSAINAGVLTAVGVTGSDIKISGIASGSAINAGVLTAVGLTGSDAKISGQVSASALHATTLKLGDGTISAGASTDLILNAPGSDVRLRNGAGYDVGVLKMGGSYAQTALQISGALDDSGLEFIGPGKSDVTVLTQRNIKLTTTSSLGEVQVIGVLSASAGITGSSFLTVGAISGSIIYGDGSQLIGVSSGPLALATGSARLSFATGTGILTLSGSITASNGITGSAFKADGVISAGTLTASGDIYGNLNQANPGQSDTYVLFQQDGTVGGTNEFNFDDGFSPTGRLQVGSSGFQTQLTGNLIVSGAGGMGNDLLLNVMGRDSGSILYVSGSGKVGINTATPTHALTVVSGAISGSSIQTTILSASALNLAPVSGSKAGPTSYLVLDTKNNVVLTAAGGAAGPAGPGGIFTTPNGSTAYTTSSVQIGGNGTPTHPLEVIGLLSASAGLTGSALKVDGAISGSILYGDGSQLSGVSSGPASLASGSVKLKFSTSSGELSGSGPLKMLGDAQFAATLAVTGNVSTEGNLSASGQLQLAKAAGHGVYIDGTQVLSHTSLGSTVQGSSLTSVGTLGSLSVGNVTSTGVVSSSNDGRFLALDINNTANVIDSNANFSGGNFTGGSISGSADMTIVGAAQFASTLAVTGAVSSSADGRFLALDLDSTANVLTKTTLGSSVVNSSLTSLGTLVGVTSSSPIVANGGVKATELSSSGRAYLGGAGSVSIGGTNVLTKTTLGSSVVGSSLTSVGTLVGVTSSNPIIANAGVKSTGHVSSSGDLIAARNITGSGDLTLGYDGASSTAIYVNTSRVLTQTDLGSSVLASSLTSVGTLVGVTSSSPVVANGGVKATTLSASTAVYAGESRFELQPSFGAYANSNQTTTAGVFMHVSANVEDYDIGGGYNTTTCVYTAPKTGTYFLTATTRLDSVNAGGYVWTKIVTTDKDYFGDLWNEDDDSTGYGSPAISIITHMTAGDTAKVYVLSSNLTANTSTSNAGYVMFQGHMLG